MKRVPPVQARRASGGRSKGSTVAERNSVAGGATSWGGLMSSSIGGKVGTNDEDDRWQKPQSGSIWVPVPLDLSVEP